MKLVTLEQMREIESEAIRSGSSVEKLMELAGKGIADFIEAVFEEDAKVITALVGTGNNGGDALVALAKLASNGWETRALLARPRDDVLVQRLVKSGGLVKTFDAKNKSQIAEFLEGTSLVLDGVLGAGVKLPLKQDVAEFLDSIGSVLPIVPVIAVDCPSGVDLESGEAAPETIPADLTLCMGAIKDGLLRFPAYELAGEMEVVDLHFNDRNKSWKAVRSEVIDAKMVSGLLPDRDPQGHKGTFGTLQIAAGSTNFAGAALLSARAAYLAGVGLVRLAIPESIYQTLAGQIPEATWLLLPHEQGVIHADAAGVIRDNLERVSAMLLGPGWGREASTAEFLKKFVLSRAEPARKGRMGFLDNENSGTEGQRALPPLVIDADGLILLAKIKNWQKEIPTNCILTPHPGEMSTLTGLSVESIQSDRIGTAGKYAKEWDQVVVLKGALTVIAEPGGGVYVVPVASSALAKAGSGDVLAGIIASLRAQGLGSVESAVCGAWIHAQAGLAAAETVGDEASVVASDVIASIPIIFTGLR